MTPRDRRGFILQCDTCPVTTHQINTANEVVAQRVATTFLHWKVYNDGTGWKRACPACVKKYQVGKGRSSKP
jgi:hypothetical protein